MLHRQARNVPAPHTRAWPAIPSAPHTDGFKLGFTVSGAVMLAAFLAAVLLLRDDGRGQPINLAELQAAG